MYWGYKNLNRAFTLLEMLMGIAVLIIVATVVASGFRSFLAGQEINAAQEEIVSILRRARERTLSSYNNQVHGVHFDIANNEVILFEGGTPYVPDSGKDEKVVLKSSVQIEFIKDGSGAGITDFVYERLSGDITQNCSPACTVSLKSIKKDYTRTITINDNGGVETN